MLRQHIRVWLTILILGCAGSITAETNALTQQDQLEVSNSVVLQVREYQRRYAEHLHFDLARPIVVLGFLNQKQMRSYASINFPVDATIYAAAHPLVAVPISDDMSRYHWSMQDRGEMGTCGIIISSEMQLAGSQIRDNFLAHEVFHCFQFHRLGFDAMRSLPKWLKEGSAEFAAENLLGRVTINQYWEWYFTRENSLLQRDYDGVGFFFHLRKYDSDYWNTLVEMLDSGERGAFNVAFGKLGRRGMQSWPMSLIRRADFGTEWDMQVAGLPAFSRSLTGNELHLLAGEEHTLTISALEQRLYQLIIPARTIITIKTDGYGALRWNYSSREGTGTTEKFLPGHDARYCVKDTCVCEDGSIPRDIIQIDSTAQQPDALLAITAAASNASLTLTAEQPCGCDGGTAQHDRCLVGTWVLDKEFMTHQLLKLSRGKVNIQPISGEERITYSSTGHVAGGVATNTQGTMHLKSGETPYSVKTNAQGTGIWSTRDKSTLYTRQLSGHEATDTEIQWNTGHKSGGRWTSPTVTCMNFTYRCNDNELVIDLPTGAIKDFPDGMKKRYKRVRP